MLISIIGICGKCHILYYFLVYSENSLEKFTDFVGNLISQHTLKEKRLSSLHQDTVSLTNLAHPANLLI